MNVDRMETLLRYRAGELSREDAAAVERWPDFAALQAELDALDEAVLALPKEDPGTEALLARVRRPVAVAPRRPGVRALAIIGVALAAGAAFLVVGTTVADEQQAWVATALGDGLEVDGRPAPHATERLGRHGRLQSGRSGAQLVSRRGWVGLWPESTVSTSGGLALEKGTALLEGNGLTVRVGTSVVTIDGQAVVSAEPAEGEARVTAATTSLHPGADMKKDWLKLSSVALTAATVGGGLTVLVLDGGARVAVADEAPIAVAAGQVLTPAVSRTPRAVPAVPAAPQVLVAEAPAAPRPTVEAVELGKLERPQLVAMVQALRDEKESLLKQRAELQKALGTGEHGGDHPKRNYYRFEQEELLESAKKGEVRIRGPQIRAEGYTVKDSVRSDIGLTPDEGAKVEAIFARSTARVHDGLAALYQEIGGDPGSLSSQSMLEELRSKSLGSDYADAVRLLANVRAGLAAPPAPGTGSAISRAYFLFDAEDRRVIDELDALIGPARAEALLNHPDVGHSNNTFGVGPAPQGAKKP